MPHDMLDDVSWVPASRSLDNICAMQWRELDQTGLTGIALAYYYFSVQFRENLDIICTMFPKDELLMKLRREECATDNLSPWRGVAEPGEKMNHDEFMRRILALIPLERHVRQMIEKAGEDYLARVRLVDATTRAASIASYEDGGLERVFRSMLRAPDWNTAPLEAFRHFLVCHIAFDSNPNQGHGALARHLSLNKNVEILWLEFDTLLRTIAELLYQAPGTNCVR
jgi:hypothetical protein